jgi:hypothetical protein
MKQQMTPAVERLVRLKQPARSAPTWPASITTRSGPASPPTAAT